MAKARTGRKQFWVTYRDMWTALVTIKVFRPGLSLRQLLVKGGEPLL